MLFPRIIVTGASGFIGRRLLELLRTRYRIFALARRSQEECGAIVHPNISWHQVDIGDREHLGELFQRIGSGGPLSSLVHLAAYYDFVGDDNPEYQRTNVDGLRNVLDLATRLELGGFVFASSVAACAFPQPGEALTEESPADGDHVYARTKRIGERMLAEYADSFPSTIVRFAAAFSDWCEYPPLYVFLDAWLSNRWNARVLGGRGRSAIPYLHVRDIALFLERVLVRQPSLDPGEVLIASPDGSVNHRELFAIATGHWFDRERRPLLVPLLLCGPGMRLRQGLGRLTGEVPFERPWMARYVDLALDVDARHTRQRLDWRPRSRLEIRRRMPFLLENLRSDPLQWTLRNREAMELRTGRPSLRIHRILERNQETIARAWSAFLRSEEGLRCLAMYSHLPAEEIRWSLRLVLRALMSSVQTRRRAVFTAYCRDLAERRFQQGFSGEEVVTALVKLSQICLEAVRRDPESEGLETAIQDAITVAFEFGIDRVEEFYEGLAPTPVPGPSTPIERAPRPEPRPPAGPQRWRWR